MIIDAISDLHGYYPQLPGGNLLIVAGDLTAKDTSEQHHECFEWMLQQEYQRIVYIAGNHDNWLQKNGIPDRTYKGLHHRVEYLCDSGTEFKGLKIWGSPWTRQFKGQNPKAMAFALNTENDLAEKWKLIPDDVDILITHSPPYGIMDQANRRTPQCGCFSQALYEHVGSRSLQIKATSMRQLKLFVFGHIHESYGLITCSELRNFAEKQIFGPAECLSFPYLVNASHVNDDYDPVNPPIRIEL